MTSPSRKSANTVKSGGAEIERSTYLKKADRGELIAILDSIIKPDPRSSFSCWEICAQELKKYLDFKKVSLESAIEVTTGKLEKFSSDKDRLIRQREKSVEAGVRGNKNEYDRRKNDVSASIRDANDKLDDQKRLCQIVDTMLSFTQGENFLSEFPSYCLKNKESHQAVLDYFNTFIGSQDRQSVASNTQDRSELSVICSEFIEKINNREFRTKLFTQLQTDNLKEIMSILMQAITGGLDDLEQQYSKIPNAGNNQKSHTLSRLTIVGPCCNGRCNGVCDGRGFSHFLIKILVPLNHFINQQQGKGGFFLSFDGVTREEKKRLKQWVSVVFAQLCWNKQKNESLKNLKSLITSMEWHDEEFYLRVVTDLALHASNQIRNGRSAVQCCKELLLSCAIVKASLSDNGSLQSCVKENYLSNLEDYLINQVKRYASPGGCYGASKAILWYAINLYLTVLLAVFGACLSTNEDNYWCNSSFELKAFLTPLVVLGGLEVLPPVFWRSKINEELLRYLEDGAYTTRDIADSDLVNGPGLN